MKLREDIENPIIKESPLPISIRMALRDALAEMYPEPCRFSEAVMEKIRKEIREVKDRESAN